MSPTETRAVVTLSLMAAFADGDKHAREREEIKRIAEGLAESDTALHLPGLYQDVLLKRVSVDSMAAQLQSTEARQMAYEMAVCVCDADGTQSDTERLFLEELRLALALDSAPAKAFSEAAEAIAAVPVAPTAGSVAAPPPAGAGSAPKPAVGDAALDRTILNAAILNGALELMPETLSTMAIIPLQMKLVYGIGKTYGYELDTGHIKDLLATLGVGLTSQYLESAGRKLLGGLLGKAGGGLLRGVGKQAVSSGMSFAATYALGHVARQYYAGGRVLSTEMLKQAYAGVTQEAQGLQARYLPDMQDKARTLDAGKLLSMVRR